MANGGLADAVETFAAPIETLIIALGQGIAEAQRALDISSLQTQEALDTDPQTAQLGLQATWYQFPKVDLELKLAVSMAQSSSAPAAAPTASSPIDPRRLRATTRLIAQPVSAAYQTQFSYDAQAASTLSLSIVPVPAPQARPAQMTLEAVTRAALASPATDTQGRPIKFATVPVPGGDPRPDPSLRFDVNFNAVSRLWYVLQYAVPPGAAAPAIVSVDDATGAVRVISTP